MIRYTLRCADGHSFDSWFPSADAYDAQAGRGLVSCAICGSSEVEKSVMAPSIGGARRDEPEPEATPAPQTTSMSAGPLSRPGSEMEAALRALREKVEKNSTYVGKDFAREARAGGRPPSA